MEPLVFTVDLATLDLLAQGVAVTNTKRLSALRGVFEDDAALQVMLAREDPVVYEYSRPKVPPEAGQLCFGTSAVHPGKVGDEYFMTRGHYHADEGTGEVYFCLGGTGILLLQSRDGRVRHVEMSRGVVAYVPPYFAHRTINTGPDKFVCFYCFPADAGHDYESTRSGGFLVRVKDNDGRPILSGPGYPWGG